MPRMTRRSARGGTWFGLDGRRLSPGDRVEVKVGSRWMRAVFEWSGRALDAPRLRYDAGLTDRAEDAELRWPLE